MLLIENAILYPEYDETQQHSRLMHGIQRDGFGSFGEFLSGCLELNDAKIDFVLLSGEDFENCLIDTYAAIQIEKEANQAGFQDIIWLFVYRPIGDYVESLYSEMSKHGVVLDKAIMLDTAKERGAFFVSTRHFNYIFSLDYWRHEKSFSERISGTVVSIPMEKFTMGFAGKTVFQELLSPESFAYFEGAAVLPNTHLNERLPREAVEENYVATALKLDSVRRMKLPHRLLLRFLGKLRLRDD